MRSKFDEQLHTLNIRLIQMGQLIEKHIQEAIDAFVHGDGDKARDIMLADEEVDKMQRDIENICFELLIQQQPVARDLRTITAAMKMVTDMERIGDHATDISEMTEFLSDYITEENLKTLKQMASEATVMLIQSIDAFT
ncbi:MAG: PhoU domain-containing protein, partial [bacterium]|nr:PhoU domain-containing protein [bacterium]